MLYPEYPSYSNIEKRIKSFTFDWVYLSGSRLSNQIMAQGGFFYMGGSDVCCYYCVPQARLKYEVDGSQNSKRIIFKES
ncbi:unnamed protein product, partial [Rotaria sordida]